MSVAAVTVSVAVADNPPEVAVIIALPVPTPLARPVLDTVAMLVDDEVHDAVADRSCVVPSLYTPVAANDCDVPFAMLAVDGVTWTLVSVAAVTVSVAVADNPPEVAVIVALPAPTPVARPVLDTVAMAFDEEVHDAVAVRSWVEPSL